MFVVSKLFWTLTAPGNLLLIILTVGVALGVRGRRRAGTVLCAIALAGFLAIAVLPIGTWLATPLENRFPAPSAMPANVTGIVVLGGAVDPVVSVGRGQPALLDSVERLTEFRALARRYPSARLIFTGGSGRVFAQDMTEDAPSRLFLGTLGLSADRVLWERRSRNTRENALYSHAVALPQRDQVWILVTSALHMPRAVGAFGRVGWTVLPYPVDYRTVGPERRTSPVPVIRFDLAGGLALTGAATREWVGLVAYRLLDWTDTLFPGPR
ncbi:MAG: YdcF family protein [Inquilinaceae bacterium]